jgi:hypothetical protein
VKLDRALAEERRSIKNNVSASSILNEFIFQMDLSNEVEANEKTLFRADENEDRLEVQALIESFYGDALPVGATFEKVKPIYKNGSIIRWDIVVDLNDHVGDDEHEDSLFRVKKYGDDFKIYNRYDRNSKNKTLARQLDNFDASGMLKMTRQFSYYLNNQVKTYLDQRYTNSELTKTIKYEKNESGEYLSYELENFAGGGRTRLLKRDYISGVLIEQRDDRFDESGALTLTRQFTYHLNGQIKNYFEQRYADSKLTRTISYEKNESGEYSFYKLDNYNNGIRSRFIERVYSDGTLVELRDDRFDEKGEQTITRQYSYHLNGQVKNYFDQRYTNSKLTKTITYEKNESGEYLSYELEDFNDGNRTRFLKRDYIAGVLVEQRDDRFDANGVMTMTRQYSYHLNREVKSYFHQLYSNAELTKTITYERNETGGYLFYELETFEKGSRTRFLKRDYFDGVLVEERDNRLDANGDYIVQKQKKYFLDGVTIKEFRTTNYSHGVPRVITTTTRNSENIIVSSERETYFNSNGKVEARTLNRYVDGKRFSFESTWYDEVSGLKTKHRILNYDENGKKTQKDEYFYQQNESNLPELKKREISDYDLDGKRTNFDRVFYPQSFLAEQSEYAVNFVMDGISYEKALDLTSGQNDLIMIQKDQRGHDTAIPVSVLLETIPTEIVFTSANLVNEANYLLTYTVNGVEKSVSKNLDEGINQLTVTEVDASGHEVAETFTVTLDTIVPKILFTSMALTNDSDYVLTYTVDGVEKTESKTLTEGQNTSFSPSPSTKVFVFSTPSIS